MELNATSLIVFPLVILLVITAAAVTGLGTEDLSGEFIAYQSATATGTDQLGNAMTLNDIDGNPVCYYNQTSCYGESGLVVWMETNTYPPQEAGWKNATNTYQLFYDTSGEDPVYFSDLSSGIISRPTDRVGPHWEGLHSFNLTDSWGWLALVAAITAIVSIVGFKIAASGESETSIQLILKSTFFITVWVTLSIVTYPIILLGGFMVFIAYFGLTLAYACGVILNVGGG